MKFLFYISKKYSIPIVEPIIEYLEKTEREFAIFTAKKVRTKYSQKQNLLTSISEAIKFSPNFVIVTGNFVDYRIPGIKVQIFHGIGVEKTSHYKIRHFFDVYCTSGPFVTKRFLKLQKKYKYFLVKETGWSKIDYILNYPVINLKEKFQIPKDKKIILFAPTHSKKMQSAETLIPIIPKIIKNDEIWIFKFHELMNKNIKSNAMNSNNIRIIKNDDITPYLHISDVLITDTSSVAYEFMILDKPVITFKTQSRKDKGIDISEPEKLRNAIDRSLQNSQEFHQKRIEQINEINPRLDGKISENLIRILENIIEDNELKSRKKPLNLFRKFQIHYHEKFKKGYFR